MAMGRHNDVAVKEGDLRRADLLIGLIDSPSLAFSDWEQGFIAALTWFEKAVDEKVRELAARPLSGLQGQP